MERWKDGSVEEWKDGGMEGWRLLWYKVIKV